jgi:hypothetical protein
MMRRLLALGSLATTAVSLWLLEVSFTVLPAHDPAHVAMWRGVALASLAYAALCAWFLAARGRVAWLRSSVLVGSALAIGFGGCLLVVMARVTEGRFEGYLVVMGVLWLAHGLTGMLAAVQVAKAREAAPLA